ncbi:hypothetical protein EDB87DRAFT_1767475 [Lactarius vividus]|nr:hypothetical protein EDB87DRAFT_1767475 [Lactarius vividus]
MWSKILSGLTEEAKKKLSETLIGFVKHTSSSNSLPEPIKVQRAIICAKALDSTEFPEVPNAYEGILFDIVFQDQYILQTTKFGHIVRGWSKSKNSSIALLVQAMVSYILVRAQCPDDSWSILASGKLGVPVTGLRDNATLDSSLSLAMLIHVTCQQFRNAQKFPWPGAGFSEVLDAASKFNVQNASPKLQHKFCALWNQIVLKVQNDNDQYMVFRTLSPIHNVYTALHEGTDSAPTQFSASPRDSDDILRDPSSYPLCNITPCGKSIVFFEYV